jgi:hypothetical protein
MPRKPSLGQRATVAGLRIAIAVLTTAVACSEPPDEHSDGGEHSDAGIDAAADTLLDTTVDVAIEVPADAGAEASPDGEPDHPPAVDLTDDVVAPVDVVADVDEPPPTFQVIECTFEAAGFRMHARIWSDGTLDRNGNLPRLSLTAEGKLLDSDLAALLEAARAVSASTAGTTTTTGPPFHSNSRSGRLQSRGRPEQPFVLVESLEDGRTAGRRTYVRHDDPAADIIRRFSCIDLI